MTELQNLLRSKQLSLGELSSKYDIGIKRHPDHDNLVMFKYGIKSPMGEKFVQECRGIILDEADNWAIVNHTFSKFFNHGEGHAADIDWATAKAFTKYDGSLVQLYWYNGGWHFATSGTPNAGADAHGSGMTFLELIYDVWRTNGYGLPTEEYKHWCFAFEIITKWNKIVVQYGDIKKLVLLGARNKVTGAEALPHDFVGGVFDAWEKAETHPLQTKADVLAYVDKMNGIQGEGFVICDANFNRIKVKAPHYVALHQLRGEYFNQKRALEIIIKGEVDEVISYFPEFKTEILETQLKFNQLKLDILKDWETHKHLENQKDFALCVKDKKYSAALFMLKRGKTLGDYINETRIESLLRLL